MIEAPDFWKSVMLPPAMRRSSGHLRSHVFVATEFVNTLSADRAGDRTV
ncbi:MAG: hypothetical protein OXN89_13265 [Bryobacterales bacterium]|nr:hypothetical protein [Bryobacterales bacterium]